MRNSPPLKLQNAAIFCGSDGENARFAPLPLARGSCIRSTPSGRSEKLRRHPRPRGGVVTQRSAKPFTPVQFRPWPPLPFQVLVGTSESDTRTRFRYVEQSVEPCRKTFAAELP